MFKAESIILIEIETSVYGTFIPLDSFPARNPQLGILYFQSRSMLTHGKDHMDYDEDRMLT